MRFDPVKYVEDAVRYQVTGIGGAPPVFVALLQVPGIEDADLSSVRGDLQRRRTAAGPAHRAAEAAAARRGDRRGLRADRGHHAGHRQPVVPVGHPQARHGRRADLRHRDQHPPARRRRPAARRRARRGLHPRPAGDARLRPPARRDRRVDRRRRLVPLRRRRDPRRGRLPLDRRPHQGHAALQGLQRVPARAGGASCSACPGSPAPRWSAAPTSRPGSCRSPTSSARPTTPAPRSPSSR